MSVFVPTPLYRVLLVGMTLGTVALCQVSLNVGSAPVLVGRLVIAVVGTMLGGAGYVVFRLVSQPVGDWRCVPTLPLPWARRGVAAGRRSVLVLGGDSRRRAHGFVECGTEPLVVRVRAGVHLGVPLFVTTAAKVEPPVMTEAAWSERLRRWFARRG